MSAGSAQHDALFGPPSNPIQVSDFIQAAGNFEPGLDPNVWLTTNCLPESDRVGWLELPESQRDMIEASCRVDDIQSTLNGVISDPRLMAHVTKTHEANIYAIHETADTSNRRKRKRALIPEPSEEHPDVTALRTKMEAVGLKSWPLMMNAALFIRPPKQSDHNTLVATKRLAMSKTDAGPNQALVFVTVYNPVSWGHRLLARSSQHVLLSSQTLGDFFETIPCTSHEIPRGPEQGEGEMVRDNDKVSDSSGVVICINGVLHGDGQSEKDYADKYLEYVDSLPDKKRPTVTKSTPTHDTNFADLSIRLHTPYWLLHAGDCIHHFAFEQIRLLHPTDPSPSSYPLTTQITPPLLDICRACNKVPAVFSVIADVRLGESPFVICRPCWRWMGMPKGEEAGRVMVVPLPKHEFGWSG